MNKAQTIEAIAVMQAYVDGAEIEQHLKHCGWSGLDDPAWDWVNNEYRIKPKPRDGYVRLNDLHPHVPDCDINDCIHMREIL